MIGAPAIAAISAAILAYEVLLVRLFAIVQWHHFAFMAISIALLGFGVSGTLLALRRRWFLAHGAGAFAACAALFGFTSAAAFLLAQRLPFNALEIVWNPAQLLVLGAIYLLLAVPFTAGATCVGLAFMAGGAPGRIYLWNLVGSGVGALGMVGALTLLSPVGCLAAVAALGLAAAALNGRHVAALSALAVLGAAAWWAAPPGWTGLRISEFKPLSQALRIQDARLVRQRSGPLALVSAVESPVVPFRHAPGLSLLAPAVPGPQIGLFVDGDGFTTIEDFDGSNAHLAWSTDALAYALTVRPRVLVLGAAGGRAVLQALRMGAAHVDAVEADVNLVRMVREDFAGFAGGLFSRPDVTVHVAEPRSFLAGTTGNWDVIRLPALGASGVAAGGRGLSEDYLLTREAFELCLRRLAPGGWLTVTGAVDLPPRAALRLVATALAALERQGVERPAASLVLIRGLTTFTLLVKHGEVGAEDIAAVKAFAASRSFDLGHYPGMPRAEANRVNVLAAPELFDGVTALAGPGRDAFVAGYKFDIRPATDDRPYFHDFLRWRAAPELFAMRTLGGAAMLEWGKIVVAATLVQAAAFSALLILAPLRAGLRSRGTWRIGGYFFALGLAFLFLEIAFIQKFTLYLGHPVYAVAVVLTGFLVFAGLGAGASAALGRRLGPARAVAAAAAGIAVAGLGYWAALLTVFAALAHLPEPARVTTALALIAPLAFGMGMPFPLGLAEVARRDPALVPWAWAVNGCASVISAAAATLLAMHLGFAATVAAAVVLYGLAALAFPVTRRP
jgi:spermidine synthase